MLFSTIAVSCAVAMTSPPCSSSCSDTMSEALAGARGEPARDIVEVASAAGDFNTLLAAAKAAGLVDTLKGDGPLTVFAPTDEAFGKLPRAPSRPSSSRRTRAPSPRSSPTTSFPVA